MIIVKYKVHISENSITNSPDANLEYLYLVEGAGDDLADGDGL